MSIPNEIADVLEDIAARLRNGTIAVPAFYERFNMTFLSRPDPAKDGYQMTGRDGYNSMDDAVKAMAHKLAYNGGFVSLQREVTITEDVTEELKTKLRPLVPTELNENMRSIYPDWTPPVI